MRTLMKLAALAVAAALAACAGSPTDDEGPDRFPTSGAYPAGTMERIEFTAGVPEHWRISALQTP